MEEREETASRLTWYFSKESPARNERCSPHGEIEMPHLESSPS
jgi:hypothetical protein